jgi:plasmid maintenance system antidote protein VapI
LTSGNIYDIISLTVGNEVIRRLKMLNENFKRFINENYKNLRDAATDIGFSVSTLCRLLKNERSLGGKTFIKLEKYCKNHNLKIADFFSD